DEHAERDQAGANGYLVAFGAVHARGHRQEKGCQPRRIDGHEQGDEGVEYGVEGRHRVLPSWRAALAGCSVLRPNAPGDPIPADALPELPPEAHPPLLRLPRCCPGQPTLTVLPERFSRTRSLKWQIRFEAVLPTFVSRSQQ